MFFSSLMCVRFPLIVPISLGQGQSSAQRVGFFSIGSGRVGYWTKYRVAGRNVEIYDQVFPGISFISGYLFYFRVFRVFSGMLGIFGYIWVYPYILGLSFNIKEG